MEFGSEYVLFAPPATESISVAKPKAQGSHTMGGARAVDYADVTTANGGTTCLLDLVRASIYS